MKFVCIATGPSLTDEDVAAVRHLPCIAISNAYQKAPWAKALASADARWWNHYQPDFDGPKYSVASLPDTIQVGLVNGSNSGLLGLEVAVLMGATSLILLGYDMKGSHYFGPHPKPLQNTQAHRFEVFKRQLSGFRKVPVVNCSPDSALECFPKMSLKCALALP